MKLLHRLRWGMMLILSNLLLIIISCTEIDPEPEPPIFTVSPADTVPISTEVTITLKEEPAQQPGWSVSFEWWTQGAVTICKQRSCTLTSHSAEVIDNIAFHQKINGRRTQMPIVPSEAQAIEEIEYEWPVQAIEFTDE